MFWNHGSLSIFAYRCFQQRVHLVHEEYALLTEEILRVYERFQITYYIGYTVLWEYPMTQHDTDTHQPHHTRSILRQRPCQRIPLGT